MTRAPRRPFRARRRRSEPLAAHAAREAVGPGAEGRAGQQLPEHRRVPDDLHPHHRVGAAHLRRQPEALVQHGADLALEVRAAEVDAGEMSRMLYDELRELCVEGEPVPILRTSHEGKNGAMSEERHEWKADGLHECKSYQLIE